LQLLKVLVPPPLLNTSTDLC